MPCVGFGTYKLENAARVTTRDRNDSRSGLASLNLKANLSELVLGCIEADVSKEILIFIKSQKETII